MALTLVTGPTASAISLADVKAHLRIDTALEDATLAAYVEAAQKHLEGPDGWLGRTFITTTWDWTLDRFPYCRSSLYSSGYPSWSDPAYGVMRVPLPPLQSVTSISYIDADGNPQTVNALDYSVDTKSEPGRITPAYGKTWPTTRPVPNAVTVRFVAGYGAGAGAIPRPIRIALLGIVGDFYTNRDALGTIPGWVSALLASYRIMLPEVA